MPYTCHLCADAEAATVLITPLQGGDTMAIGPDCMVTGLCGLLSVATQTDAEALYDAIIKLRQDQDQQAAAGAAGDLDPATLCGAEAQNGDLCARPDGHRGNHNDGEGHAWRNASPGVALVPESEPAPA